MSAQDNLSPKQFFHGSGNSYSPGAELDDKHGSGLWLTHSQKAASHYARLNAMGQREYYGNADAAPHVYEVSPAGLQPQETGFRAKSATVLREAEYKPPNNPEPWDEYAKRNPPSVLE